MDACIFRFCIRVLCPIREPRRSLRQDVLTDNFSFVDKNFLKHPRTFVFIAPHWYARSIRVSPRHVYACIYRAVNASGASRRIGGAATGARLRRARASCASGRASPGARRWAARPAPARGPSRAACPAAPRVAVQFEFDGQILETRRSHFSFEG